MNRFYNIACSLLAAAGTNFLIFERHILGYVLIGLSLIGYFFLIRISESKKKIVGEYSLNLICGLIFFILFSMLPFKVGEDDLGIGILMVGIIIGYFYIITFITGITLIIKFIKETNKDTGENL